MKNILIACICMWGLANMGQAQTIENWQQKARQHILKDSRKFKTTDSKVVTKNSKDDLTFNVDQNGFEVWSLADHEFLTRFDLLHVGKGSKTVNINGLNHKLNEDFMSLTNDDIEIQYVNKSNGFRQNFVIAQNPDKTVNILELKFAVTSPVSITGEKSIQIHVKDRTLSYSQLKVWDANKRPLDAKFVESSQGMTIVVNDENAQYPITVDPLVNTWSYMLPSTTSSSAKLGWSQANVGDVNGDDYEDIVLAASGLDAVYLFFGGPNGFATSPDWDLSISSNLIFGKSVAGAGDVDNDGYGDILIGEAQSGKYSDSKAYVFYGRSGTVGPDKSNYWYSTGKVKQRYGWWVDGDSDVNGDGIDDIIIGAPSEGNFSFPSAYYAGAYVWYGSSTRWTNSGALASAADYSFEVSSTPSVKGGADLGDRVSFCGDLNGDGKSEIVVSDPLFNSSSGRVNIIEGGSSHTLLTTISGPSSSQFGKAIETLGDLNGDGYSELGIGAPEYDASTTGGRVYSFEGGSNTTIQSWSDETDADWNSGSGLSDANARFGHSISRIGDFDGDGYNDVAIGAPKADNSTSSLTECGLVRLYLGDGTGSLTSNTDYYGSNSHDWMGYEVDHYRKKVWDRGKFIVSAPKEDYSGSVTDLGRVYYIEDNISNARHGYEVTSLGDFDNDGINDFGVCAEGLGKVDVFFSGTGTSTAGWSAHIGNNAGVSITSGDFNGDGYLDLAIGESDYKFNKLGKVEVYYGSSAGLVDNTADWHIIGHSQYGRAMETGDVNGDGEDDLVVIGKKYVTAWNGGSGFDANSGKKSSQADWFLNVTAGWRTALAVGDLNNDGFDDIAFDSDGLVLVKVVLGAATVGTNVATIAGSTGSAFGASLAIGDRNGDGYGDLAIGAPVDFTGSSVGGIVYIFNGYNESGSTMSSWSSTYSGADWNSGNGINEAGALFGFDLDMSTDMNGDGQIDLSVGIPSANNGTTLNCGKVRTYTTTCGSSNVFSDQLSSSPEADASFGYSLSCLQDFDANGTVELLVGAPFLNKSTGEDDFGGFELLTLSPVASTEASSASTLGDVNGDGYSDIAIADPALGKVMIYYGSATGYATSPNLTISGPPSFGTSVSTAGDIDGDGYSDMIVGAPKAACESGAFYVYRGSSTGLSSTVYVSATGLSGEQLGFSVACAGDIDGDGISEFVVGAPGTHTAYVYGIHLQSLIQHWFKTESSGSNYGYSVSSAGDIDADGHYDVIIGAPGEEKAYVYLWDNTSSKLSTTAAWTAEYTIGTSSGSEFGYSVSCAGDVNADNYSDLVIGAPGIDKAFLWIGATTFSGNVDEATADWTSATGQTNSDFGHAVKLLGDINGDGYGDFAIGAPKHDPTSLTDAGAVTIVKGGASLSVNVIEIEGTEAGAEFGYCISSCGDANGDGYSDRLITSPSAASQLFSVTMGATGYLDTDFNDQVIAQGSGEFGHSLSNIGDVNGDGYDDFAIGSPDERHSFSSSGGGVVHVYYGKANGTMSGTSDWQCYRGAVNELGLSVAGGDFNGDGFSDLLVGSPNTPACINLSSGAGGFIRDGKAFLFLGSINGLSNGSSNQNANNIADLRIAGGEKSRNHTLTTSQWWANGLGHSVAMLDMNGDGYSDIAAAQPSWWDASTSTYLTKIIVIYGAATLPTMNACSINSMAAVNSANADVIIFREETDYVRLTNAGDINGDGMDDLMFGYKEYTSGDEFVEVFYGTCNGVCLEDESDPDDCNITTVGKNDLPNWKSEIASTTDVYFGHAVASAGNVDGDSYSDIILGAPHYNNEDGAVFVLKGSSTGLPGSNDGSTNNLLSITRWQVNGTDGMHLGAGVSTAGDVNAGGFDDVIFTSGDFEDDPNNPTELNIQTYAFFAEENGGKFTSSTALLSNADWNIEYSEVANPYAGFYILNNTVSSAGDYNGDGYADVLVGWTNVYYTDPSDPNNISANSYVSLYNGNEGHNVSTPTIQYYDSGSNDLMLQSGNTKAGYCKVNIGQLGNSPIGLNKAKLSWEIIGNSSTFLAGTSSDANHYSEGPSASTPNLSNSLNFESINLNIKDEFDVNPSGASTYKLNISEQILGSTMPSTTAMSWRSRLNYSPANAIDGQLYSRWYYSGNGDNGLYDFRLTSSECRTYCPPPVPPIDETVGTTLPTQDEGISLYPNPATNMLTIEASNEIAIIAVYSLSGTQVMVVESQNASKVDLDISSLSEGLYTVQIQTSTATLIKKFQKI